MPMLAPRGVESVKCGSQWFVYLAALPVSSAQRLDR
jgi:hypothetical protein